MRISVLPLHVANQIAAGEVIERPASVVKELLENALDAGASHIHIDIGFGGLNQITVSDNGRGILSEDLPLAIAANATSKLRTLDDLYTLSTMGFRGEALASIASISRLTIQSRPEGQAHAMGLCVEAEGVSVRPCARGVGTTVDIRDLFFNAPVRKNFLKTEALEYLAIESVVKRFAFSEPGVALTLVHNGKPRLVLPAAPCHHTKQLRLRKLLGKAFVDQAISVDVTSGDLRLQGWVSGAGYARSLQDKQWIYINRRMVKDKLMLHALKVAYEHVLHPGRHPACLLYLTILANEVDVNVHPTKHEVRFHDPRSVHDLIRSSVAKALGEPPLQSARAAHIYAPKELYTRQSVQPWICLNARFAILFDEAVPYLVDVVRLHQETLRLNLSCQPLPWVGRPLLVPVSIAVHAHDISRVAMYGEALASFGFIMEAHPLENAFYIRAIPRDLPGLDLHAVINLLIKNNPPEALLSQVLIASVAWDARSITEEEKVHLMANWSASNYHALRLDEDKCQELLYANS